jgi:ATP-dependent DNA helicase PIF1
VATRLFNLRTVFRQTDPSFVQLLNEVRIGKISEQSWAQLEACRKTEWPADDPTEPTRLFPHRDVVDRMNSEMLSSLPGESHTYDAEDTVFSEGFRKLLDSSNVPAKIMLKINAQVILLKNLDFENELVNGALGTVVGFEDEEGEILPLVRFKKVTRIMEREEWAMEVGGTQVASRRQVPLNLAWALSVHKSQGMTLQKIEISLERVFAEGQAYVALSRVTGIRGLRIVGQLPKQAALRPNPKVLAFSDTLEAI